MLRILRALCAALFVIAIPAAAIAQFADQRTWAPSTGGSANAQTVAIPNVYGPPIGVVFRFIPSFTNTGPATLNINLTGAKSVTKPTAGGPAALTGGELIAGQIVAAMFDGVNYQLISNLNAAAAQVVPTPQGYLTPCKVAGPVSGCSSGNFVPTGDVVGASTLYYEPIVGNLVPIWNGSQFVPTPVTESQMTLTLGSSNLANTIYDVCIFNNSGVPTIVTGPAWTTSAAGSGARGTGAGTAEIVRLNGLWVNNVSINGRNGGNSYTIPANQCTIVASIFIDSANGQVSFHRTYGQNRKWGVWNFYNRQKIYLKAGDSSASWTPGALGPANGNTANSLTVISGVAEESYDLFCGTVISGSASAGGTMSIRCGIGFNSTSASSGFSGITSQVLAGSATVFTALFMSVGSYQAPPSLGINVITLLNAGAVGTVSGGEQNNVLTAQWRG